MNSNPSRVCADLASCDILVRGMVSGARFKAALVIGTV